MGYFFECIDIFRYFYAIDLDKLTLSLAHAMRQFHQVKSYVQSAQSTLHFPDKIYLRLDNCFMSLQFHISPVEPQFFLMHIESKTAELCLSHYKPATIKLSPKNPASVF